ncbi:hypothetical protein ACI8B_30027 [Acinetobacter proteolyticus]|uniref:Uncharacterized protein n=1 Tax=Acinetobacter proteolyticus TaxID=1776741 RepID=A0A653K6M6_9GAMM|nr:hypothetical protein ACI8B_30027 [Acinetobacter proteolyticus]
MGSGIENTNLWWRDPGSNWGHTDFQSVALPTELSRQSGRIKQCLSKPVKQICGFFS